MKKGVKRYLKLMALMLSVFVAVAFSGCAVMEDYDYPYDGLSWNPITYDQAVSIWNSYNQKKIKYHSVVVYSDDVGTPQKFYGAQIKGKTYKEAQIEFYTGTFGRITLTTEELDSSKFYYQCKSDSNLILISSVENYPSLAGVEHSIYDCGWLVESVSYRNFKDMDYLGIQYK